MSFVRTPWRLTQAAKAARYLGRVEADAFEDHRNPDPHLTVDFEPAPEPHCEVDPPERWRLPTIQTDIGADLDITPPDPVVYGYEYRACDQPFHLECWRR